MEIKDFNVQNLEKYKLQELHLISRTLLADYSLFCQVQFFLMFKKEMDLSPLHKVLFEFIDFVLKNDVSNRAIISIPPRIGKTLFGVSMLTAWAFFRNNTSQNIIVSYNSKLSLKSNAIAKQIIQHPVNQLLYNLKLTNTSNEKWETDEAEAQSLATSIFSFGTGFGANTTDDNLAGFLIGDDLQLAATARSQAVSSSTNFAWSNTFMSRLNNPSKGGVFLIQQRLSTIDTTESILTGGEAYTNGKFHHLQVPALLDDEYPWENYPEEYIHGIPYKYTLPKRSTSSVWEKKLPEKEMLEMKASNPMMFYSQYQQSPKTSSGTVFKNHWFKYYGKTNTDAELDFNVVPELDNIRMYCDLASKTKSANDFTCFQIWGYSKQYGLFLLDMFHKKVNYPEAKKAFIEMYTRWEKATNSNGELIFNHAKIEDASNGVALIQDLPARFKVKDIWRSKDKYTRFSAASEYVYSGRVHLPFNKPFKDTIVNEACLFTEEQKTHDDAVEGMVDAIDDFLMQNSRWAGMERTINRMHTLLDENVPIEDLHHHHSGKIYDSNGMCVYDPDKPTLCEIFNDDF